MLFAVRVVDGAKDADFAVLGVPDIDALVEADCDEVGRAPVEEVEVIVVDEARGVKDAFGRGSDTPPARR